MLHPSISDQRCACQGFRRNKNLPGAHCECGHQACYHLQGNTAPQLADTSSSVSSASYLALLDRIHILESQHQRDRKLWQEELKEERRARREEVRLLREAMYSFFQFMEQEVPRQFVDIEDKIESVVDRQQQLQERVVAVDDSSMVLEDRISDLEKAVWRDNPDQVAENDREGSVDMDHRDHEETKSIDGGCPRCPLASTTERNPGSPQRRSRGLGFNRDTSPDAHSPLRDHSPDRNGVTSGCAEDDEAIRHSQDLPALSDPDAARTQDIHNPECQLSIQAVRDCDSGMEANSDVSCHQPPDSPPSEIEEKPFRSWSTSPLSFKCSRQRFPSCSAMARAGAIPIKRKRHVKDEPGRTWALPNPPPLSLSDSTFE
jgi:hypothetical protein